MNPTVTQWMYGLRELWPDTRIVLLTNGTYLDRAKGLFNAQNETGIDIEISLHHETARHRIYDIIGEYMHNPNYTFLKKNTPQNRSPNDYFHDHKDGVGSMNIKISVIDEMDFLNNSLISHDDKWTLSDNNPQDAHDACHYVEFKTYNFIKGKLYKCGNVMHYLDLIDQGLLEIPNEDIALLNQYKPLTIENYTDYNNDFYNALDTPIPQCKMCVVDQQFHSLVDPYPKK
jgi:hypothetical protein